LPGGEEYGPLHFWGAMCDLVGIGRRGVDGGATAAAAAAAAAAALGAIIRGSTK
jgi:hypothetical protein